MEADAGPLPMPEPAPSSEQGPDPEEDALAEFAALHGPALRASGVPERYWGRLLHKLEHEVRRGRRALARGAHRPASQRGGCGLRAALAGNRGGWRPEAAGSAGKGWRVRRGGARGAPRGPGRRALGAVWADEAGDAGGEEPAAPRGPA